MNWFSLALEPGVDGLIEDAWKLAWEVARSSNALDYSNAIFQKPGPGKFEVTIYFSPSARRLAASFGAKRCDKPSASGMSLVAGDERASGAVAMSSAAVSVGNGAHWTSGDLDSSRVTPSSAAVPAST